MVKLCATERQLIAVMAAAFAVSNFGHGVDRDKIKGMIEANRFMVTARYAVSEYAGHLIESDSMEELFVSEAESWERDILAMGIRHYIQTYEKHNDWMAIFKEDL